MARSGCPCATILRCDSSVAIFMATVDHISSIHKYIDLRVHKVEKNKNRKYRAVISPFYPFMSKKDDLLKTMRIEGLGRMVQIWMAESCS